jgi:transporter family protein
MNWLVSSLVAMACWGIWGLLMKLASKYFSWHQIFIVTSIVTVMASLTVFIFFRPAINVHSLGFSYALLAGVVGSVALVAFNYAIEAGKSIIVVPLSALYPIVTIVLSFLVLHEEITLIKAVGIALGLAAILLISMD